jgi:hypothetical protein
MTPERCAALIIRAGGQRKRQVILTTAGKLLVWLYQFFPGLLDRQLTRVSSLYD